MKIKVIRASANEFEAKVNDFIEHVNVISTNYNLGEIMTCVIEYDTIADTTTSAEEKSNDTESKIVPPELRGLFFGSIPSVPSITEPPHAADKVSYSSMSKKDLIDVINETYGNPVLHFEDKCKSSKEDDKSAFDKFSEYCREQNANYCSRPYDVDFYSNIDDDTKLNRTI